jgi:DegV family protein with EDD domain
MTLSIDGQEFTDGVDITASEFYTLLQQSPGTATTSAPSPAAFVSAFEDAATQSNSILCIVVASEFSATEDSARTASEQFVKSHPGCNVTIMDSESAAGGEGLIALGALKQAANGGDFADVQKAANSIKNQVRLLAYVDTLFYLWKGGRVPRIAHAGASLLKLKPIFELRHSKIENHGRPRTTKKAMNKLISMMSERVGDNQIHVSVNHAASEENALKLHQRITDEFDCAESYVTEFTPVMGAHIGPGMIGVAFWEEPSEAE